MADPIILAAQARPVIQVLHQQDDVVVRFKSDKSGYVEDALDEQDRENPGHFKAEKRVLTLDLDTLVGKKPLPKKLDSIEDFRQYPVLAGVAAHESAHARFTLWGTDANPLPPSIPNPDYQIGHVHDDEADGEVEKCLLCIESFPVSGNGKLVDMANLLEEPRVERLGQGHFTKTWRRAMQFSASHLILERITEDDENEASALDAAVNLAILVGGRVAAGTLGASIESRAAVRKVLDSAQKVIEEALPDAEDPYHAIQGIVSGQVFNNDHEYAGKHLEAARQILSIVYPEDQHDPDNSGNDGEGDEEGENGGGSGAPMSAEAAEALSEMRDAMESFVQEMQEQAEVEADQPEAKENKKSTGHGATIYQNPQAPQVNRYEQPNANDRALYKSARDWMEKQIEPTITEGELDQWLPTGGARLDVRGYIRDNLAGHQGSQRQDWTKETEAVKPAPPVKVAIMLDGSGSMGSMARPSAAIAWAAANAAADLPESRTVSVVYGARAQVTQAPGHLPAKQLAISNTDGPWENFKEAAQMVEDALWLDEPTEEGERSNVLIIIVSDLQYGAHGQSDSFIKKTAEWHDKGYKIMVVGATPQYPMYGSSVPGITKVGDIKAIDLVQPEALFK